MDNSNRKISTIETILKNITQERDSAVSQLGIAYFTIEQLKVENEGLKTENDKLKNRLDQLGTDHENETKQWAIKEEALRRKVDRKLEAERSMIGNAVQHPQLQDQTAPKARHSEGIESDLRSSSNKHSSKTIFDLHGSGKPMNELSTGAHRTVQIDDSQDSEDSVNEAPKGKGKGKGRGHAPSTRSVKNVQADETSQNLTFLSFLEVKDPLMLV